MPDTLSRHFLDCYDIEMIHQETILYTTSSSTFFMLREHSCRVATARGLQIKGAGGFLPEASQQGETELVELVASTLLRTSHGWELGFLDSFPC